MKKAKRMMAAIMTAAIISTFTAPCVYAADENPDLAQLASLLGADTDMFSFPNYVMEDGIVVPDEVYEHFMLNSLNSELCAGDGAFVMTVSSGHCLGFALLEVLSHNGMIKPSDIQDGAETLNEITYDIGVEKYLSDYQLLQNHLEWAFHMGNIDEDHSYEEKSDLLIKTAERCMANDQYFLITIRGDNFAHAVAGIGIAEGRWEFDGEVYDKCILTIDSNAQTKEGRTAFYDQSCIYVNSENKKLCVPSYMNHAIDGVLYITVSDDMYRLNYKGTLGVNDRLEEDISDTYHFAAFSPEYVDYSIMITDRIGNEELLDNDKHLFGPSIKTYVDAPKIEVKMKRNDTPSDFDIGSGEAAIASIKKWITYFGRNTDSTVVFNNDIVRFRPDDTDTYLGYSLGICREEGTYSYSPNFFWQFNGVCRSETEIELKPNGVLCKCKDGIITSLTRIDKSMEPETYDQSTKYYFDNVIAVNDVFLTVDEDGELVCMRDAKGDGSYDTPVETGDVDCSGTIDAADASVILAHYAAVSVGGQNSVNKRLGDYNNDGTIDSVDASEVLQRYAEASTSA